MGFLDSIFRKETEPAASRGKIESFSIVLLHLSGMRITIEYETLMKGEEAELSLYEILYSRDGDRRSLRQRVCCSKEEMLRLLNACEILKWDGFHGDHPRGVTDGTMFTFTATVNGERKLRAEGSENFPKHFREYEDGLRLLLDKAADR